MLLQLLLALRRLTKLQVPNAVWVSVMLLASIFGVWSYHQAAVASAFSSGYTRALDSAAQVIRVDTVDRVVSRTDTVIHRVTQRIATTDTLIALVPETVRVAVPAVDTALKACTALSQDCAALRASVLTERAAWGARDTALRLTVVAKNDTLRRLGRRWTRKTATFGAVLAAGAGFFAGRR